MARPAWPGAHRELVPILGAAFALRLFFALTHPIDYNAYWHVFIARNLSREYSGLAHPPLFLLLLKLADAVSHSALAYQSVSLLSGVGVVALTHRVLGRLGASSATAQLGAWTMAVAQPAVVLSCGVQSYMLAAFFILWSILPYLDLVSPNPTARRRPRIAFAVLVSLGLLTEYYTAFYLLACVAAPFLLAVFRRSYREWLLSSLPRRLAADVATLLPPAVVAASIYLLIARPWVQKFNTLPQFYFQPGLETAAAFLIRNLWNLFNTFSPFLLGSQPAAAALVLGFVALVFLASVLDSPGEVSSSARAVPAAILAALLAIGMAMGLKGPYPFGGLMRQQFLYFLFAVPAGFIAFDRLLARLRGVRARRVLVIAAAACLTVNLVWHARDFENVGRRDFAAQARIFHRSFPDAATIQVDQLNLIGFFMAHDDWSWKFLGAPPGNPLVQRYALEKGGRRVTLIAHRDYWNFDFHEPGLYPALRAAIRGDDPACFAVFCVHTNLYKPAERRLPDLEPAEVEARIAALAPPAGLKAGPLVFQGNDVYGEFCVDRTTGGAD